MNRAERRSSRSVAKLPYLANATGTSAADISAAARTVNALLDEAVSEMRSKVRSGWDDEVAVSWLAAELARTAGPEGTAVLAAAAIVRLAAR